MLFFVYFFKFKQEFVLNIVKLNIFCEIKGTFQKN